MRLVTLPTVVFGNWLIKASSFDDQILIFCFNMYTMEHHTRMFYDEETAFYYIEGLINDTSNKIIIR